MLNVELGIRPSISGVMVLQFLGDGPLNSWGWSFEFLGMSLRIPGDDRD